MLLVFRPYRVYGMMAAGFDGIYTHPEVPVQEGRCIALEVGKSYVLWYCATWHFSISRFELCFAFSI